jgi:glucokinase
MANAANSANRVFLVILVVSSMRYVIGCDVGGTRLKYAAVAENGRALRKHLRPSGADKGPEHIVDSLTKAAAECTNHLGAPPAAMAFGISGAVDPNRGVVLIPGKFANVQDYPLVPKLRKLLKIPVVAENDGRISIFAEKHYGAAKNKRWAVCITLGTGVGSGVMLDGQILRDPFLQFGTQLGHVILQADGGRLCLTGARGTSETLCSATALEMQVRDGLQRGIPSVLTDSYLADPRNVDFAAIIRAVEANDRLALDELRRWTEHVGWLLVTAAHSFAPEVIILSGGAVHAANHFLPQLQSHLDQHLYRYPKGKRLPVVASKMGEYAGAMGAAALAWTHAQGID